MNEVQKLQLELMKQVSFNEFNGPAVVAGLEAHQDLWTGAVMTRLDSLIQLRDIAGGNWNVDTLYILPRKGKEDDLESLARRWDADEIYWIGGEEASLLLGYLSPQTRHTPRQILALWWD
jgi:hypothetical protein